ncbi:NADPH-dependent 1-acyldihydroxyacetone phosphate reductase [Trametes pubescens]|uniref:NADPH-dependent 1-acyldihydroxyacetone phosphate reductase n=1 Tax=Trametes pubescens TaxID=154538 RepID=A0A1M2VA89_TRAPU|nr:NADPH-dependent 1-acyldihydroxyacetone phosphate reductase [Trametes pubescens]
MVGARKVVLITGCSEGGIGFWLAKEYAAFGCKVYATARRTEAMASLVDPNIDKLRMDVTDEASIKAAVDEIIEKDGRIDVLVNNAGMTCSGPIAEIDFERITQTYNTNVFGVIRTAKAVIPHMASLKSGTIVNIGSVLGEIPLPFTGVYASSKAAVHALTDALYMECQPLGISVVLVAAGGVRTMGTNFSVPSTELYPEYAGVIAGEFDPARTARGTPPEDFARVVVGKSLARAPARVVVVGLGSSVVRFLTWFPRGWVLRTVWNQMVEKHKVALAKSK